MRKQLGACVLILLCACLVSAQRKTNREIVGLRGAVKSVREEAATLKTQDGQTVESARILRSLTIYDEQGNRIESTRFDFNGAVLFKTVYSHDAQGNSVSAIYDGDGNFLRRTMQLINAEGKPDGLITFGADRKLHNRMVETRGTDGRLAEGAVYDANGLLLSKSVFTYDSQGKQIDVTIYDSSNRLMEKTIWAEGGGFHAMRYDESGNIWFESTNKAGTVENIDPQGNWTEQHTQIKSMQKGHTQEYVSIIYRTIEYYSPKKQ